MRPDSTGAYTQVFLRDLAPCLEVQSTQTPTIMQAHGDDCRRHKQERKTMLIDWLSWVGLMAHSTMETEPILTHHSILLCQQKGDQNRAPGRGQASIKSHGKGLSLHCYRKRVLTSHCPLISLPSSPLVSMSTVRSTNSPLLILE